MKKLVFILMAVFAVTGCSEDDDALNVTYELAEIVANDLPEEFEFGEVYEVTVTYVLESRCHQFIGLDAQRGNAVGEDRRQIYVAAISILDQDAACDTSIGGEQGTAKFSITIDEEEEYTFNFLVGESNNEPVYQTVVVPVVDPESN
ncbi:hypothetical protein E0K83_05395 [Gramella sp. BOM4]|nr:hypothetical protein [Christiangramia bathymodioli]